MSLSFPSAKETTINRVKALTELLLPFLVFGLVVFLSSAFTRSPVPPNTSNVDDQARPRQSGWLFADTASSSDATVEITHLPEVLPGKTAGRNPSATMVTSYTVWGTF